MMKISYYAYTNKGGRPNNEDIICCGPQQGWGLFILTDCIRAPTSGQVSSSLAARVIARRCMILDLSDLH